MEYHFRNDNRYAGKPLQVLIAIETKGDNFVASAYVRDASAETRYQEMAKKSTCLYLDTEKLNASGLEERTKATLGPLSQSVSVKTPQDFLASPYTTTIPHSGADVNRNSVVSPNINIAQYNRGGKKRPVQRKALFLYRRFIL